MLNRRSFLQSAGAGFTAAAMMGTRAFAGQNEPIPLGIQLWTVKSEIEKDLEGTLRKLHAYGFREIEFAGFYGRTAASMGTLLKSIGLTPVSMHVSAIEVAKEGPRILADAQALGLKYIVCSSPGVAPEKQNLSWEARMKSVDLADWRWNAQVFNRFGQEVSAAGMKFGYHNHVAEFRLFDGKTAFDHLFGMTDAKHVHIELDVGWVTVAQQDPVAILNQYRDRVIALHVKDVAKRSSAGEPPSVALGEGTVNWKPVLETAKANGTQAYFYEQEEPFTRPILESARMSAEYFLKLAV